MNGSWMSDTYCMEPYTRLYFDLGANTNLYYGKQLCEDVCTKSKHCLSADLYYKRPTQENVKTKMYACHLMGTICNEERLVDWKENDKGESYYHFRKGKLMMNYLNT